MRKWQKKDKDFRKEIEKRLVTFREKIEDLLRMLDRKCKLKESREVILLLKKIDKALDVVRFVRHRDAELAEEEDINHKILSVFEIMSEIETLTEGSRIQIMNLQERIDFLIKEIEERESLIRAFLEKEPPLSEDIL
ncbi:MAG: hypothetical protein QME07_05630 [bacterium]|nr:hypothetical protein [bacterium]